MNGMYNKVLIVPRAMRLRSLEKGGRIFNYCGEKFCYVHKPPDDGKDLACPGDRRTTMTHPRTSDFVSLEPSSKQIRQPRPLEWFM